MAEQRPLRFGILGAARIAPDALIKAAQNVPDAEVVAVAARDPKRAREFADAHGIPRVLATYDDVVNDPELQSAAELASLRVDDRGAARRKARAMRKAACFQRRRG